MRRQVSLQLVFMRHLARCWRYRVASMTTAGASVISAWSRHLPHKYRKSRFKEFGGSSICEHDRRRGIRKECLGGQHLPQHA